MEMSPFLDIRRQLENKSHLSLLAFHLSLEEKVYGRENRLKVKRDEAQANAEQAHKDAIHQKAESQFRHSLLLQRANARLGATESSGDDPPRQQDEDSKAGRKQDPEQVEEDLSTRQTAVVPKRDAGRKDFDFLGYLNSEGAQHPEVEADKKKELARRGDAATQTSDARFDAQFRFGNGLTGEKAQPWYAMTPGESLGEAKLRGGDRQPEVDVVKRLPVANTSEQISTVEKTKKGSKKEKKKHKKEKRHKKGKVDRQKSASSKQKLQLAEILRAEREARERSEQQKARQAVREAHFGATGEPEGKRYHSGYTSRRRHS